MRFEHGGATHKPRIVTRCYTSRISNFFPHAAAYLRKVATEGDCLSLASEASKREIPSAPFNRNSNNPPPIARECGIPRLGSNYFIRPV